MEYSYDTLEVVDGVLKNIPNVHSPFRVGKLAIVKDPEGKRRVIAMVDYHSQLALKSIHEQLLNLLSKLPCDRTFTQDPNHNWDVNKDHFHSLDLSSATDRFPIKLQQKLLGVIYNDKEFAQQ